MIRCVIEIRESALHPGHCNVDTFGVEPADEAPSDAERVVARRFGEIVRGLMEQMLRELAAAGHERAALVERPGRTEAL